MIGKLRLQNYKCFNDQVVQLKPYTILTGINAVGKSSIIQALLLYNAMGGKEKATSLILNEILRVDVGTPKNLVNQNGHADLNANFCICVDEEKIAYKINKENPLDITAIADKKVEEINMIYLNAERLGPRLTYQAGGPAQLKSDGSNAVYLMEIADNQEMKIHDLLLIDESANKFSIQVEAWMSAIFGDVQIEKKVDNNKATAEFSIKNSLAEMPVVPTMTGFGLSYELSIIVAGLWMSAQDKKGVLLIENPEAHLHPSAQSKMAKFLAIVASTGVQVLVETHSEHIVDGARIQMMAMDKNDDLIINYLTRDFENKRVVIKEIFSEKDGELTEWPEDFFDQKQKDLRDLFMIRRNSASNK